MLTTQEHDRGLNTCDKCTVKKPSLELIWITAEDFEPMQGEVLSKLADRYDALCNHCYQSLLK